MPDTSQERLPPEGQSSRDPGTGCPAGTHILSCNTAYRGISQGPHSPIGQKDPRLRGRRLQVEEGDREAEKWEVGGSLVMSSFSPRTIMTLKVQEVLWGREQDRAWSLTSATWGSVEGGIIPYSPSKAIFISTPAASASQLGLPHHLFQQTERFPTRSLHGHKGRERWYA